VFRPLSQQSSQHGLLRIIHIAAVDVLIVAMNGLSVVEAEAVGILYSGGAASLARNTFLEQTKHLFNLTI
jgi:hypothetical protein